MAHWLADAFARGTRRVLFISGAADTALRELDYVDEIALEVSRTGPVRAYAAVYPQFLASGFRIIEIAAHGEKPIARLRRLGARKVGQCLAIPIP